MRHSGYKYIVRFPDGMRERIASEARANHRSINGEIVHRIERSLIEGEKGAAGTAIPPRHTHANSDQGKDNEHASE